MQKKDKRKERKLHRTATVIEVVSQVYAVHQFTPSHYRVEGQVDLYPKNRRYHILASGERGQFTDESILVFLETYLVVDTTEEHRLHEWKENFEGLERVDLLDDRTKKRKEDTPESYLLERSRRYTEAMAPQTTGIKIK